MTGKKHIDTRLEKTKHVPVLLAEAVSLLSLASGKQVIDATLGGGGHTAAILRKVLPGGRVLAIDTDREAIKRFRHAAESDPVLKKALADGELILAHGNFADIARIAQENGFPEADAILADLGFSSDQIEDPERGLSFEAEGALDMRLDRERALTAMEIVNRAPVERIERILREFGDEPFARDIARRIGKIRATMPLATTTELTDCIRKAIPSAERRRRGKHPEAKAYQAFRIAVNDELANLGAFLPGALRTLKPGGTIAVISFHSGEDRIVKQFLAEKSRGCVCPKSFPVCVCGKKEELMTMTKKPIVPGAREQAVNPRSRSAKLRAAKKNTNEKL